MSLLPACNRHAERLLSSGNVKKPLLLAFLLVFFSSLAAQTAEATRGCCSWHGGVSYCDSSAGRYVCNDGTYSPSCGCAYSPQAYTPPVYIPPTPTPTPIPLRVNATYELSPITCTYTVTAAWEKPSDYDQYSVSSMCDRDMVPVCIITPPPTRYNCHLSCQTLRWSRPWSTPSWLLASP